MYRFVSALLRKKGFNQRFTLVDLTNVKMSTLFKDYRDGYIELSHPSLRNNTFVELTALKSASNLNYNDAFFPTWLSLQGSVTILGVKSKPKLVSNQITYSDAIQAGCTLRRVRESDIAGKNTYPLDMMPDVYLNKTLADYKLLQDYVLTTVNGLCHLNIPAQRGILIRDAGKTLDVSQDNNVGIISFENIGKIQHVILKDENIVPAEEGRSYRQAVYIDLNKDLTGKSVMFSFCGRLFVDDEIVKRINNKGGIRLDIGKLDIFQIIQDSIGKIDLSSLKLDERMYKNNTLKIVDVLDDDVVYQMLKLTQTFFVIVDAPNLYTEKQTLVFPRQPGYYERFQNSKLPYIDDKGIMYPYWKMIHPGTYTTVYRFHVGDTFYRAPLAHTGGYHDPGTWLNSNYDIRPRTDFHTGHLLNIFVEALVYPEL